MTFPHRLTWQKLVHLGPLLVNPGVVKVVKAPKFPLTVTVIKLHSQSFHSTTVPSWSSSFCLCSFPLYFFIQMVFFKTTQKIDRLRLCQGLSTLCKFVNALLMFFFQCTQQRPTLTMSKFVYVLYICTYWWWSSFHLYYQQKTDWHWHCQSHSTFSYTGDGLLSTFLSFPSVTSPPYYMVMVHSPLKRDGRRFLLQ